MTTVLDLFAGPGGWSVACQALGLTEVGVDWDRDACATARAAGHTRVQTDVRDYIPATPFTGLIASPPCQTFSRAGSGSGRDAMATLVPAVGLVAHGAAPADAVNDADLGLWPVDVEHDERTSLVIEPLRFIRDYAPTWVALEQVPEVVDIWRAYAYELTRWGYSTVTGIASTEQWGVPQTRRRAILLAHRERVVKWPAPTHSRYYPDRPSRRDPGVLPWVSMATALGWDAGDVVGFARRADDDRQAVTLDGIDYRARDLRAAIAPAQTVTEKSRSWTVRGSGNVGQSADRPGEHPAPMITGRGTATVRVNDQTGTPRDAEWPARRPATVVAGRDLIADPGQNSNRFNGSTKSRNDGIRVSVADAGVLQGFPADYPWQGTKTSQHQQVGDAIPPPLATAILRELVDIERVCTECGNDIVCEGYALCSECLEETS